MKRLALGLALTAAALAGSAFALSHAARRRPTLAGCPVFPASNVWNQPVNTLPVAADSAQLIASIGLTASVHADFGSGLYDGQSIGIPYVVVNGKTTPKSRVKFDYADESDKGPYPIPSNVPIEGYPNSGNGDRHALIVDRSTCKLYELYALRRAGGGWAAGSGAIWNLRSNALRPAGWTSADAAGLPILPGLARLARGRGRPDRPRAPIHGVAHPQYLHLPGAPRGEQLVGSRRCRRWGCASG